MASEWREMQWGDLATLEYGKGLRGYENCIGKYRVYGTNGPIGWYGEPLCHHSTVVVGRKGAYRGIHFSVEPCFVIDTAFYLEPRTEFDMRWAYYELLTHDINSMDSGSAIPSTSREAFYRLPVRVPVDIAEQRAIAHVLGTLDDKIELNRRMNETLEAMARAIFKSWFVECDPVRAKLALSKSNGAEGRQPSGMDATTTALFPDSFYDSTLGKIPRGWSVGKVSELARLSRDGITPTDFPSEVFNHYSVPAFDEGRLPKAEVGESIKSNKFFVPDSAVLLSKLNPRIPRVWLPMVGQDRRSICSTEFFVTIPSSASHREFVYGLFSSQPFMEVFVTMVTGTSGSHQRVQPESLLEMDTIMPPTKLRDAFADVARPLLSKVAHSLEQSRTLAAIRDALLPKLISGELCLMKR